MGTVHFSQITHGIHCRHVSLPAPQFGNVYIFSPRPDFLDSATSFVSFQNCPLKSAYFFFISAILIFGNISCIIFSKTSNDRALKFLSLYSLLRTRQIQGCCCRASMNVVVAALVHSTERAFTDIPTVRRLRRHCCAPCQRRG